MKYRKTKNTASFLIISLTIALIFSVMIGVSSGDGDLDHVSIGDFVWADLNVDGIQDTVELGIPGVIVNLYNGNDIIDAITTTNETGKYLFDNLDPGDYYIEFVLPIGYAFSPKDQGGDDTNDSDANTTTGKTIITTLLIDEDNMTLDAGMYVPCTGSIGDFVWHDQNRDGIQDAGEPGIDGVTVNLKDSQGTVIATTTDPNGFYQFTGLCAGYYTVEVDESTLPPNFVPSPCNVGGDDTVDNDCSPVDVNLPTDNTNNLTIDFGYNLPCTGSIGDFVWNDLNRDGIQNAGEPGIEGVTVDLYDDEYNLVCSTDTDETGYYQFINLDLGDYYLIFELPDGYLFTLQDQGTDDTVDSDADPDTGKTVLTTLECGENDLTWDAGMYQPQEYCGCSHGFWKNHQDEWIGYTPAQALDTVFTFPDDLSELADNTLDDALRYNGGDDLIGGAQILLRNAVASLLNAAHPGVNYQLTESEVITQVNDSLASLNRDTMLDLEAIFDIYNNQGGCLCDEENDVKIVRHSRKTHSNREIVEEPPEIISDEEISDEQENEGDDSNAKDVGKKLGMLNMKEEKFNQQYGCSGEKQETGENLIDSDEFSEVGDVIDLSSGMTAVYQKEDKGIPGLGVVIVVCALSLVLLLRREKNKK